MRLSKHTILLLILITTLILMISGCSEEQIIGGETNVTGTVKDASTKEAIQNAKIRIHFKTTTTDETGGFYVTDLPSLKDSNDTLSVNKDGYHEKRIEVSNVSNNLQTQALLINVGTIHLEKK